MKPVDQAVRDEIVRQIADEKSVAPRDIAQALAGEGEDWRKYLPRIRAEAIELYHAGELSFLRKRKPVSPSGLKGVYRLSKPVAAE
ncbi:DUF3253 domain-containing protein [Kordiimonas gwangyangensis]|uniref:DUF3253 domain-containing protein n=1 Tax=Kordiimonas gwangyangensis TaxID=288022 RepID=UPI00036A0E4B|nr:DUF3253 domain-containing protein [Kordiimonas gwangyangensis]